MYSAINWYQIIGTVVISSVTSLVVTQTQAWFASHKDREKTILSTLEFFRAILDSDNYFLGRFIAMREENAIADKTARIPLELHSLNLHSSITDYVGVFKVHAVLAKQLMLYLHNREHLINVSHDGTGMEMEQIKTLQSNSKQMLDLIEELIAQK